MGKKTIFKGDLKKVLLIEKSIFSDIWAKTDFYKLFIFLDKWAKENFLQQNVDIIGDNIFCQENFFFPLNVDI